MEVVVLTNADKHSSKYNHITAENKQKINEKTPEPSLDDGERSVGQSVTVESIIVMQINLFS